MQQAAAIGRVKHNCCVASKKSRFPAFPFAYQLHVHVASVCASRFHQRKQSVGRLLCVLQMPQKQQQQQAVCGSGGDFN